MEEIKYGVCGIGNAIVDVVVHATEEFIEGQKAKGMIKGSMMLIDEARAVELYASISPGIEMSGGSVANTMAGYASFGGKGAYIGKVADDQLGEVFRHDLKALGVDFQTQPLVLGAPTARCLILVTPDAERTMNTFLGACVELNENDIDQELIEGSQITYIEGYLFDKEAAIAAFYKAAEYAKAAGRKIALTLSDPFCVDRHREAFKAFIDSSVDILFANEEELKSLYQTETFDQALDQVQHKVEIAALTRGSKGSLIINDYAQTEVTASTVDKVVDTTGAGDAYAAGFLYGVTAGESMATCGRLGSLAAAEVIRNMGPRSQMSFTELLKKAA